MHRFYLLSLLAAMSATALAQPRLTAPVERCNYAALTGYDSLKAFVGILAGSPGLEVSTIATTHQNRSVFLVRCNNQSASPRDSTLRILLFAQQHGDEPSGKEAMLVLLSRLARGEMKNAFQGIDLYIVPQMNPDGSELRQRRTATGVDLNRSHLLLNSPETAGLHEAAFKIHPHVTLDVHEFGAFSTAWTDSGLVKRSDVQLGMLTNLNSSDALKSYQHDAVFPFITQRMKEAGYAFQEYIVGSPSDRVRHSTTEINDGRQSFGILNTLSFIQEGRHGKTLEEDLERRVHSQLASILALLTHCQQHRTEIACLVAREQARLRHRAGQRCFLRMEHVPGERHLVIPVSTYPGGRDTMWDVTPYHSVVHPLVETSLPSFYVVPARYAQIMELLTKHHVEFRTVGTLETVTGEHYVMERLAEDALEEDTLPKPIVSLQKAELTVDPGDILIPTDQWHSMFLATLLEPESMWGLSKYKEFEWMLKENVWPVSRIP